MRLNPCASFSERYLNGSCSSGPSAIQPAAMCKASTTWSLRSSSSTSSSTLVSTSCSILSVTCCRCDSLPFFLLRELLLIEHFYTQHDSRAGGFMTASFREWTPGPLEIVFSFVSNLVALLFPRLFLPSVRPHFGQIWIFQTRSVFNCALEHYLSKLVIRLWEQGLQMHKHLTDPLPGPPPPFPFPKQVFLLMFHLFFLGKFLKWKWPNLLKNLKKKLKVMIN